jgi:hypothetical protein
MIPRRPQQEDVPLPLSFAQERLWFVDQSEPGSTAYSLSTAIRLSGRLDVGALVQSLEEIVHRPQDDMRSMVQEQRKER